MRSKAIQSLHAPSLLLAAALQVLPVVRVALPAAESAANVLAIIFRWAAGAAALSAVDAVSGASTVITSPLSTNIPQGVAFTMRLITGPNQAHYWTAIGLPAGLGLSGTNGSSLWKITGTPSAIGTFNVALTAKDSSTAGPSLTTSATMIITVTAGASPPAIASPPASLTVTQNQSAAFSVTATGATPLNYQWRFNGANLSGQTASNLTINPVSTNHAGSYDVIVANGAGSVTSAVATLTVIVPAVAPTIATSPASLSVTQGLSASFSVTAGGTGPLSYQWRFKGGNLSGQSSSNLVLNPVSTNNAGSYDVIVANSAGSITSAVATLTVIVPTIAPTITTSPASLSVTQGLSAGFSVTAGGTAPLNYQWRFNGGNLSGQISSNLVLNPATTNNAGSYDVIVANSAGSATSAVAILTVIVPGNRLQITAQPASQTVTQGWSASFSVTASGTTPLNYQWRFNGANLSGQISSNLVLNPVSTNNAGSYDVIVANGSGSVTSAVAGLTVFVPPVAPAVGTQPASLVVTQGNNAAFSVLATGTAPLTYLWSRNGTSLSDNGHFTGSQSNLLTITGAQTNDAGNFQVVISNAAGSVTSSVAVLTVVPPPPVLAPLTVQISGVGTIAPYTNGQPLQIGASYTLTATPGAGSTFLNWSGSVAAGSPTMTFVMASNLVLRANFVSDTATFVAGTYQGLFYESSGVAFLSSGPITLTTTARGAYAGVLTLAGQRLPFAGRFDASGRATNSIPHGHLNPLMVELALAQADPDVITGRVTDGTWSAPLQADRAVFDAKTNRAPQAGTYTIVIPGTPDNANEPAGSGFGFATVDAAGRVHFVGTLADGTAVAQATTLSKAGDWPFYATLYGGQGLILGWLSATNRATDDINGALAWFRLQQPSGRYYPGGFGLQSTVAGSRYTPPAKGNSSLTFSGGQVDLSGGNLAQGFTNQITLAANKVTNLGTNRLLLTLMPGNGLFLGSAADPQTGKLIPFRGVVLEKQNAGWGFFLGASQSGMIHLGP